MKKLQIAAHNLFSKKYTPQYLLVFFLIAATLPACRVKEGCAASQRGYTNNMERTKKRGKTSLFPKSVSKKMKH
ncbi:MAG: hypothetical protein JNL70_16680 [Saprospiraceae bacterium]|nr:hypothetical protein [Saprospiraceae bacterium]